MGSATELSGRALALAANTTAAEPDAIVRGVAPRGGRRAVFMFPGQGSQWPGMALELPGCSPVFAEQMRACGEALAEHVDWSLEECAARARAMRRSDQLDVVQPVLFAVMVSVAALWRALGVRVAAVVGHSQGEIAAAYVAGGLSLQDAARVVVLRSRAMAKYAEDRDDGGGCAQFEALRPRLEKWGDRITSRR